MAFEMKPMSTWKAMRPKMTWLGFGLGLGRGLGVRLGLGLTLTLTLTKPPSCQVDLADVLLLLSQVQVRAGQLVLTLPLTLTKPPS